MRTPLRTAVIGFGLAGRVFHAPLIADDPGFSLDVIVTGNADRAREAAALHPGATVVPSWEDVSARADELDVVVVATPPASHVQIAHAALDHRLAVVVDKPLCASAAEAATLVERAESIGVPLTVFHNRRWDAELLTLRGLLERGALGEVYRFESRIERWKPVESKPWKATATAAEGGGVLYDLGTHLIDQALHLFGPVVGVVAELDSRRDPEGPDDDAFVALEHRSGVRTHIWVSSVVARPGPRMRVLGSRAVFIKSGGDGQEAALAAGARPSDPDYGTEPASSWGSLGMGEELTAVPSERGRYGDFYAGLAGALRDGGPLPVDPRDAVDVIAIIEDIHRAARRR